MNNSIHVARTFRGFNTFPIHFYLAIRTHTVRHTTSISKIAFTHDAIGNICTCSLTWARMEDLVSVTCCNLKNLIGHILSLHIYFKPYLPAIAHVYFIKHMSGKLYTSLRWVFLSKKFNVSSYVKYLHGNHGRLCYLN